MGAPSITSAWDDHFDLWKLPLTADGTAAGAPQLVLPPSELDVRHVAVHPRGDQLAYVAHGHHQRAPQPAAAPHGLPAGPSVRIAEDCRPPCPAAVVQPGCPSGGVRAPEPRAGRPALWLLDLAKGTSRALTRGLNDARDPDVES